jgi:hypothetical protein
MEKMEITKQDLIDGLEKMEIYKLWNQPEIDKFAKGMFNAIKELKELKEYEVSFNGSVNIKAKSFEHARELFTQDFPAYCKPTVFKEHETLEEKQVIGFCEISGFPIFETDTFESDAYGIYFLSEYLDK